MGYMNKKKGLREVEYFTTDELVQWMKLGYLVGELEVTAGETKNAGWRKKLKTACTLTNQVLLDRVGLIDPKQLKSVVRRKNHTDLVLVTSDQKRVPNSADKQDYITIACEDLNDLADLALNSCAACPQGKCVKDCFYRTVMHRLGLPVCRDEIKEGECEFNWQPVGEVCQVVPQNQRLSNYYEDDNKL